MKKKVMLILTAVLFLGSGVISCVPAQSPTPVPTPRVESTLGQTALRLIADNGEYHLVSGAGSEALSGGYTVNVVDEFAIQIDFDAGSLSLDLNGSTLASNKPFLDADFVDLSTIKFTCPPAILEAFPAAYVADEIKVCKLIPSYRVGVYYYPWYLDDFHGGRYLREHLVPPQEPMLGEYNDRNPDVISQHLEWSRYAGIDFWVTSWWGPDTREDVTLRNHILQHTDLDDFRIAIFYETQGRTENFTDYSRLGPDIAHLAEHYFGHPNYLRIDGKPVLFVYLTRVLSHRHTLESSLHTFRSVAADAGYQLFIVGDQVFGSPSGPPSEDIALLDGITNYDAYGSMGATGYVTQAFVDTYYMAQAEWKALAQATHVAFIPAVTPGFNDKAVRSGHAPLSRQLTPEQEFGSLFRAMIQKAKNHTDAGIGRMLMVTSWNEWHEDTQIEPTRLAPPTSLDDSETGSAYTNGLSYEGYGERYLQILRDEIEPPAVTLESVSASPSSVSLNIGATQQLTITATYSDASTADVTAEASYESSDTSVATVSDAGLITAVAQGSATITASYTEGAVTKTADVSVTVGPPVFDPWDYDADKDGVMEIFEVLTAISDYFAGKITIIQVLQVISLYFSG